MLSSSAGVQRFYRGTYEGERLRVGGKSRRLFLEQESADPAVPKVSLLSAGSRLRRAFRDLPLNGNRIFPSVVIQFSPPGVDPRPRLPFRGPRDFTGPERVSLRAAPPLSTILQPITLDPLTRRSSLTSDTVRAMC
jgi:hypothetical protein